MALTYKLKDITFDISKRLNDPDQKTYRYLAKSAFINALSQLVADSENYEKQEIAPLMVTKEYELNFQTNKIAIVDLPQEMMRLINVSYAFSDAGNFDGALKEIDEDQAKRMIKEVNLQPIHDEIFYWRIGSNMYFRISNDQVLDDNFTSEKIELEYVKNIDPASLEALVNQAPVDLVSDLGFSLRIIYAAVNNAVAMLKADGIDMTRKID